MKRYWKIITFISLLLLIVLSTGILKMFPLGDAATSSQSMINLPWYITRSAGLAAYVLMFLIIFLGAGMTTSYIYRYLNPVSAWVIHKYLGIALGLTILVHIFALLFDNFVNLGWLDLFIPFHSSFRPWLVALGIFGFYILLAVLGTSLFFRLKYQKTWRNIHYFVYPLFIISFFHGVFIGTDSSSLLVQAMYWLTGLSFAALLIYRLYFYFARRSDS